MDNKIKDIKKRFNKLAGVGTMPLSITDLYTLIEIIEELVCKEEEEPKKTKRSL